MKLIVFVIIVMSQLSLAGGGGGGGGYPSDGTLLSVYECRDKHDSDKGIVIYQRKDYNQVYTKGFVRKEMKISNIYLSGQRVDYFYENTFSGYGKIERVYFPPAEGVSKFDHSYSGNISVVNYEIDLMSGRADIEILFENYDYDGELRIKVSSEDCRLVYPH